LLKVLYVSPNGYLGGAERFVLTAVQGHRLKNNIEAGILFFSNGEACREARSLGLDFTILKNSFRLRNPVSLFFALREIRKNVIQFKPDILHLTMPYSHIVLSLATLGLKIPKVWFQHGPVGGRLDQIANLFPVDMIWYNSHDLKLRHHQTMPRAIVKIQESIIHLGVESKANSHQLFLNSEFKLGSAGRICSWKGFHNIIKTLGELKKEKILRPYKFFIAGAAKSSHDKDYDKELINLVQTLDLTEEVKFLSHVESMNSFYQSLDIFVHSSVIPEPFGLVVAEAMVNGCLVIASDCGGVVDLMQNDMNGISFPATSDKAVLELKKILGKILSTEHQVNIDDYRILANKGRQFVEKNYSVDKMIVEIEELYFKLHVHLTDLASKV
jgi:glycosyltransferase involved in cell wall biosynthesis